MQLDAVPAPLTLLLLGSWPQMFPFATRCKLYGELRASAEQHKLVDAAQKQALHESKKLLRRATSVGESRRHKVSRQHAHTLHTAMKYFQKTFSYHSFCAAEMQQRKWGHVHPHIDCSGACERISES